jgi:hypothetical protein
LESVAEKKALMGVAELAKGIQYEDPIKTRWIIKSCLCYELDKIFMIFIFVCLSSTEFFMIPCAVIMLEE